MALLAGDSAIFSRPAALYFLRAARLRNETAPEQKKINRCEKWFEKREEGSEKGSETCPKMSHFKPLSRRVKMSHRHFSNFLTAQNLHQKKCLYPRGSAGVATLNQRAENGGWIHPSWLKLAFFGRPDFPSRVENAPACYRAPRWPDPEFPQKIPKK